MHLSTIPLLGIVFIASLWTAFSVYSLIRNYIKARQFGLHIVVNFVQPLNPVWILLSSTLLPLLQKLPFGLDYYFNYTAIDWMYKDKYQSHERYGDAFIVVNPGWTQIIVADATAIDEIATRRKDFTKPEAFYRSLECFGPNVDTVEGVTWQRHRKITSPPFNERNSGLVWKEAIRQAIDMQESWVDHSKDEVTSTNADTLTLALHVLTAAGFSQSYSFLSGPQTLPSGHKMSYRNALSGVLKNIVPIIVFNHEVLQKPYMPKSLQHVGQAVHEFKTYMTEMISRERQLIEKRDSDANNLISSLVRASEEGKAASNSLDDQEIVGNLFIYNLAGHETTANTLAYAITLLSVNSVVQDWLHEEIVRVLGRDSTPDTWKYESNFPQLQRCLVTMYETLRLFGPVTALSKYTKDAPQLLTIGDKEFLIPQDTYVVMNLMAAHTYPRYWGSDSMEWKPKRWINADSSGEIVRAPPAKGAYKP
ncbi:MAG: hypothetical protein Q9164_005470 [Protoblastenia rupestris]